MGMKFRLTVLVITIMAVATVGCATSPSLTIEGKSSVIVDTKEVFSATIKGAYPNYGVVYTDWGTAENDGATCETHTQGWSPPIIADENGAVVHRIAWTFRTEGARWICAASWIYPGVNGTDPTLVVDWHRVVVSN